MKLTEVGIKQYQSAIILNESWQQLTEAQQVYVGRWETNVWPLMEQYSRLLETELTPDQIQKIFTSAEQVAKATGKNQTALGKAGKVTAEVTGKMKAEIEKLMKQAGDSGPVKNMDQQFDKIRSQLANKLKGNPAGQKILQGVDKWKGFAEENPAKSAFIIGAMTSLLAFASGGIMSGAAIGFFLKLANNTIKGDKLSVALAKGAKGAAIGALAGGIGGLINDLVPPDVQDVIIASDGQTIDVSGLEAMSATGLEDLEPDAVEDLLKTQNALETALRSADGDAQDMIGDELEKVSQKIGELGGAEELQDYAGLEGQDLERQTIKTTDVGVDQSVDTSVDTGEFGFTSTDSGASYTDEEIKNVLKTAAEKGEVPDWDSLVNSKDVDPGTYADDIQRLEMTGRELGFDPLKVPDADAVDAIQAGDANAGVDSPEGDSGAGATDMSDVEVVQADSVSAEELKSVGINFDAEPDISPEVAEWAEDNGIDPEELQKMFQMEKAMDDAEFLGTNISASQEMASSWTGDTPTLDTTTLPDGAEIQVGETFKSEISTSVGGIEPPIKFMSTVSVEGVDADGNAVYMVKEVSTMPSHPIWDQIDKADLSPEAQDQLFQYMNEYTGVSMDSKAGIGQLVDTFKQTLAKSIGAAATAVAVGGALADKEVKAGAKDLDKKESIDVEELWDALDLYEAGFADMIKKAKTGADKVTTAVARKSQQGVAAVKKGAASLGNELGNIVTAKKLMRMWNKAGKPTDMGSVVNILNQAGVPDEQIGTVGKQARVDLSKPKGANQVDPKLQALADEIIKLKLVDVVKPKLADS